VVLRTPCFIAELIEWPDETELDDDRAAMLRQAARANALASAAVPTLIRLVDDPDAGVRAAAPKLLVAVAARIPDLAGLLIDLLGTEDDAAVRRALFNALDILERGTTRSVTRSVETRGGNRTNVPMPQGKVFAAVACVDERHGTGAARAGPSTSATHRGGGALAALPAFVPWEQRSAEQFCSADRCWTMPSAIHRCTTVVQQAFASAVHEGGRPG
jgi:hypothetical protein